MNVNFDFTIAVIDADPGMQEYLEGGIRSVTGLASDLFDDVESAMAAIPPHIPAVVILGPSYCDPRWMKHVAAQVKNRDDVAVVAVAQTLSAELLKDALRAGMNDLVALDDPSGLSESIEVAAKSIQPEVSDLGGGNRGTVTTVFSPKGGSGKSFLATNLAVAMCKHAKDSRVALIDGDMQFGDIALMLRLSPRHTLIDAVQEIDRLDGPLLESLFVPHNQSGLLVLPAPAEPAFASQVSASDLLKVVTTARSVAGHIVVDCQSHINDLTLALLDASDRVIIIASMDIPSIKNVKMALQTFQMLDISSDKFLFVINRSNSKVGIDIPEVEKSLKVQAGAQIPSDIAVPKTINKGIPVVLDDPRNSVAKAIDQLASRLVRDKK